MADKIQFKHSQTGLKLPRQSLCDKLDIYDHAHLPEVQHLGYTLLLKELLQKGQTSAVLDVIQRLCYQQSQFDEEASAINTKPIIELQLM